MTTNPTPGSDEYWEDLEDSFDLEAAITRDWVTKAEHEAAIERLTIDGVHSCHDDCQRVACVLRRRIAELEAEAARQSEAERARIVAWLRQCQKAKLDHHAEVCHREDDEILDAIITAMNTFEYAAAAIEKGQHNA